MIWRIRCLAFLSFLSGSQCFLGKEPYPQIVFPEPTADGEPEVVLVPITESLTGAFELPCKFQGATGEVEWGQVSADDPFEFNPVDWPWIEEQQSRTNSELGATEESVVLKLQAESNVTAEDIRGLYRCRLVHDGMHVYSPAVSLIEVQHKMYTQGNHASSDVFGDVLITCAEDTSSSSLYPFEYLAHFNTSWTLWNIKPNGTNSTLAISPDLEKADEYARVIEAGGALLFSPFKSVDIRRLLGFTWEDSFYYECNLQRYGRGTASFPVRPGSLHQIFWETINLKASEDSPGPLRLVHWTNKTVVESLAGERTVLYCVFSRGSQGFPVVQWKFNNAADAEPRNWRNNSRSRRSRYAHLEFVASTELEGTIECSVEGRPDLSKTVNYTVHERLTLSSPSGLSHKQIWSGGSAWFTCEMAPPTLVRWYHNGQQIKDSGMEYKLLGTMNSVLEVINVQSNQSGSISCSSRIPPAPPITGLASVLALDQFEIHLHNPGADNEGETVTLTEDLWHNFRLVAFFRIPSLANFTGYWILVRPDGEHIHLSTASQIPGIAISNTEREVELGTDEIGIVPHITLLEFEEENQTGSFAAEIRFHLTTEAEVNEVTGMYAYELESLGLTLRSNSITLTSAEEIQISSSNDLIHVLLVVAAFLVISIIVGVIYFTHTLPSGGSEMDVHRMYPHYNYEPASISPWQLMNQKAAMPIQHGPMMGQTNSMAPPMINNGVSQMMASTGVASNAIQINPSTAAAPNVIRGLPL